MKVSKVMIGVVVAVPVLVGIGWLGTRIDVSSFDIANQESRDLGTVEPPADLPAPVARYVDAAFGGKIPVIETALVAGKADVVFNGLAFHGRFKFYYEAGKSYYHLIQLGWFGQPILSVNERLMNGETILDIPGSYVQHDAQTNAAANQGLWAEGIWLPSIWFTDDRVRWEAVDETTADLIAPDTAPEEALRISFDPQTGLIAGLTTLRYKDQGQTERIPWTNQSLAWRDFEGIMLPSVADLRWGNDPPWVTWHVESVRYNIDVSARMAQFGGDFND